MAEEILLVNVEAPHSRALKTVETTIWSQGTILSEIYVRGRDDKGRYTIRKATYVVLTRNPRSLKIALSQLGKHRDVVISF